MSDAREAEMMAAQRAVTARASAVGGGTAPAGTPAPLSYPHDLSVAQNVYFWLAGIFITSLIVADIIGSKFFYFGTVNIFGYSLDIEHSVGMMPFPITFILTDIINDYFGKRGARRVTYLGLGMAAFAFLLIYTARQIPPAPPGRTFVDEDKFQSVFSVSNRLYIASLTAFLIGQLTDISTFGFIKRITGNRMLWLRATGSTIISQAIDSLTISFVLGFGSNLADGSTATIGFILTTAAKGYALKFLIAIGITPLIYLGRGLIHRLFGLVPLPPE